MEALTKAINVAGSQSALARICGVKQGHVWAWINRFGGRVPLEHCPAIEASTGVRCDDLRPDVAWQRDRDGTVTGYLTPVTREAA